MVNKSEIAFCLLFHVLFSVELTNLFVVPSESKSADNLFVDVIFACLPIDWVDRIYQIAEKERKSMNQVINELVEKAFSNS